MKVNSKELKQALIVVKPAVASHDIDGIEQATTFAFIKNKVIAYNEEICIQHPLKIDFEGSISAEELYKFILKANDEIDIKVEDKSLKIKSGRAKVSFTLESKVLLPLLDTGKKWKDINSSFLEVLEIASKAASKDPAMEMMQCVHINKNGFIEGTDGMRLYHADIEVPINTTLLFASTVKDILRIKPTKINTTDKWCHFKNDFGSVVSCRTIDEEFADSKSILKDNKKAIKIEFPKNEMLELLDRAEIFSGEKEVNFKIKKGEITVSTNSEQAKFKETIEINCKDNIDFEALPELLHDILKRNPVCSYNKNRLIFKQDNWVHVVSLSVSE